MALAIYLANELSFVNMGGTAELISPLLFAGAFIFCGTMIAKKSN